MASTISVIFTTMDPTSIRAASHTPTASGSQPLGIANLPIGPEPDALVVWQAARENMLGEAELISTYG